jgi:thioredoxin-related protein
MKLLLIPAFFILSVTLIWMDNFGDALKTAQESHKQILINFSGSDWCGPCIRLRKEILENEVFVKYATDHLVLVRADFPRQKIHRLSAAQTKLNEALAEQYNPEGKFPFTVLVDEKGKVLRYWDGFPNESPEKFIQELTLQLLK